MIDAITTSHYAGGQISGIAADLAHLEQITPGAGDQVLPRWDAAGGWPGVRSHSDLQPLLHPDHPALATILLPA